MLWLGGDIDSSNIGRKEGIDVVHKAWVEAVEFTMILLLTRRSFGLRKVDHNCILLACPGLFDGFLRSIGLWSVRLLNRLPLWLNLFGYRPLPKLDHLGLVVLWLWLTELASVVDCIDLVPL